MNNKPELPLSLLLTVLYKVRMQRVVHEALVANHGDFDPDKSEVEIINKKTGEIFSYTVAELSKMRDSVMLSMYNHPVLAKEVKKAVLGSILQTMAIQSGTITALQLNKAEAILA